MKSDFGRTLRKIRRGKNVSICQLEVCGLSKSQISRFERGESEISCSRFIKILDVLNIGLDEFIGFHNLQKSNKLPSTVNLQRIHINKDLKQLEGILQTLEDTHSNQLEKVMIKVMIYSLNQSSKPSQKEINLLTDYLFDIDLWGNFEINLLNDSASIINYNTLYLLTKELITDSSDFTSNQANKLLIIQLAINTLMISIDLGFFGNSKFLIRNLRELLKSENYLYEDTIFMYARGYLNFKTGSLSGKKNMVRSLKILRYLNKDSLLKVYLKHYLKNVENRIELTH
ncbi:helix-turn-helix domain-containing protein [Streptococcaceae bacterium ESL0687]|nr:helix-turn-helix domain-containing protein [Streptococcaceae bacterium ESL0687]